MSKKREATPELIKQCFSEADGKLVWRNRPRDHFTTDRSWKIWNAKFAGKEAGSRSRVGLSRGIPSYRWTVSINSVKFYRYAIVWCLNYGEFALRIDHRDGDCLNDKIGNLRPSTQSQNTANSFKYIKPASGFKGAYWDPRTERWESKIMVNGRSRYLGRFTTASLAHDAYVEAAKKIFGEFANAG